MTKFAERLLRLPFPLPRTHCGIVLGNGNFGAMVWGDETLCVTVNRADFWDHRNGQLLNEGASFQKMVAVFDPEDPQKVEDVFGHSERAADALYSMRLPVGRFEFSLRDGWKLREAILEMERGCLRVCAERDGTQGVVTLALHPKRPVLWVDDPRNILEEARPRPSWEWVGEVLSRYAFSPPRAVEDGSTCGWVQACPDDPALAVLCRRVESGFIVALELDGEKPAQDMAQTEIERTAQDGLPALLQACENWWREYWNRAPRVALPEAWFDTLLNYALWKFGAATNPNSPLPSGLQGPWIEEYQLAMWAGDYHFNVNIQQIYTLAFAANQWSHALPLFDLLDSWQGIMRRNARILCDIDDGLAITHAVDDRGYQCTEIVAGAAIDHGVSGWLAQLYWLYYEYSGDETFLRERAYPFLHGVMRVYEAMLVDKGERFSLPIGISPEYFEIKKGQLQRVGKNPSFQIACIHLLTDALLQASEILGIEPRPIWREIKEKLPPWTLIGEAGEERIAIWDGKDLEKSHRHHSHLACVYPFDTLGNSTPEQELVLRNSFQQWVSAGAGDWTEWSIPWAAILMMRRGWSHAALWWLQGWREVFVNEGLATVYIPRRHGFSSHRANWMHEPHWSYPDQSARDEKMYEKQEIMELDGTMAYASAIYEMLASRRGDVIHLFPAVPPAWRDVSFENIALPHGFFASGEMEGGVLQSVTIHSERGGALQVAVPHHETFTAWRGEKSEIISLPATLKFQKGESVVLRPITGSKSPPTAWADFSFRQSNHFEAIIIPT